MKSNSRMTVVGAALACLALIGVGPLGAQDAPVTADLPVLLTSCGQSPGPERVRFFLRRLEIEHEFLEQATPEDLSRFSTLLIVTGASLKGMGAAGVSMRDELGRTAALIEEARRLGMTVIGAHVEGMARRAQGAAPGDNSDEMSIDAVMPLADLMIVRLDGNEDRRFTVISEGDGVPLILFEKNMEMGELLSSVFGG